MHYFWKRWRLALIAALTAVILSIALASPASAGEPGEWGSWSQEMVGNQTQQVRTQGTVQEARNNGNLLEVWRGADNNQVWAAWNNGWPFSLGGGSTATYASPTVVDWANGSFMVFHTGTDGHIYYAVVTGDSSWQGNWNQVPGQTTPNDMSVSVANIGGGTGTLYMVYHGASDNRLWGSLFLNTIWQASENIGGGQSPSAPTVTWNADSSALWVAARGTDNQVWTLAGDSSPGSPQPYWYSWGANGGNTIDTPAIAANAGGTMLVSYRGTDSRIQYRQYSAYGNVLSDWQADTTYWQTNFAVALAVVAYAIYVILTGEDNNNVYYKQAFNPT